MHGEIPGLHFEALGSHQGVVHVRVEGLIVIVPHPIVAIVDVIPVADFAYKLPPFRR